MSQRITDFVLKLPNSLSPNLYRFIKGTVHGTILKAYHLMMSPIYAGKTEGVSRELKQYDDWLKDTDRTLYKYCARQRKRGIAYIRLWRWFGINLLKIA